ncbi:MAG: hypothetical protein AAF593_00620 [Planctomycetota bacterium]
MGFPDGQKRIISLSRHDWQMHDEMASAWWIGWDEHLMYCSWGILFEDDITPATTPNFEERLRWAISDTIRSAWAFENVGKRANCV